MTKAKYLIFGLSGALAATALFFSCRPRGEEGAAVLADGTTDSAVPASIPPRYTAEGVWAAIKSDPYGQLPVLPVTLGALSSGVINPSPDLLTDRAVSTVADTDNLLPRFTKLLHANGICVKGRWVIDTPSPYTGAFANGTDKAFIGRISVALGKINRGDYRAFGFAGKIFDVGPDAGAVQSYKTANFFTIDDLIGTKTANFHDTELSNEPLVTTSNLAFQSPVVAAIGAASAVAFKMADVSTTIRQLYEISELGLTNPASAVTPKWMHLKGITRMKNGHPDFRRDLEMANYPNGMIYAIKVSSTSQASVKPVGRIVIEESVASDTCDRRLHFHHPKFRNDLKHQ